MRVPKGSHVLFVIFLTAWLVAAGAPLVHGDDPPRQENDKPLVTILPQAGERPISLETEKLDKVGEGIGRRIDEIGQRASRREAMRWLDDEVALGITWLKLITCTGLLPVVLAGERLFTRWVRAVLRNVRSGWDVAGVSGISVRPFSRPVSFLIWIYGIYAAFSPLYGHFERTDGSNPFHEAMKKITEAGGLLALAWLGYLLFHLGDQVFAARRAAQGSTAQALWTHCRGPMRMLVVLVLARVLLPLLEALPFLYLPVIDLLSVLLIATVAWLAISALSAMEELISSRYRIDREDNLSARRVHTQVRFVRKFLVALVVVLAAASMLMLSDKVRQLGAGILTSAGVLGIVVGLAAQRSIANLLVGLQIAVTQPIRIDDVVIIENEWGRIEEITSTYVAVRLWDLRRLVVPLTYFIEKPFQNWTRTSAEILGTVFLYTDYRVDVEALRRELLAILERSPLWDGRVWGLQVTGARENTLELRALMSAADASRAWDLRCEVREKLVVYLQTSQPSSLPRHRIELGRVAEGKSEPGSSVAAPMHLDPGG